MKPGGSTFVSSGDQYWSRFTWSTHLFLDRHTPLAACLLLGVRRWSQNRFGRSWIPRRELLSCRARAPVPDEDASNCDDYVAVELAERPIQILRFRRHIPVKRGLSLGVDDAHVHLSCLGCVPLSEREAQPISIRSYPSTLLGRFAMH